MINELSLSLCHYFFKKRSTIQFTRDRLGFNLSCHYQGGWYQVTKILHSQIKPLTAVPRKFPYKNLFEILKYFKKIYAYLFLHSVILQKGEQYFKYVPATATSNSKILEVCAQLRHSSCGSKLNSNTHFKSTTETCSVFLQINYFNGTVSKP